MSTLSLEPRDEEHGEAAEREGRPLHIRLLRAVPIILILGLLVHYVLPRIGTIQDSLETMRTMRRLPIVLAVAYEILSYLANGALLQSVIRMVGDEISLRRAFLIEIGAATVSLVAVGALGFGAAIYKWTRRRGVLQEHAMLASWLPSVFDATALVLFALIGAINLLFFQRLGRSTGIALAIVVAALGVVIVAIVLLLARNDWLEALARRVCHVLKRIRPSTNEESLMDMVDKAEKTWDTMKTGAWMRPAACSLMVLTFDLLCLRYCFIAAGAPQKLSHLLAGYGVPILLGRASFLPGGIAVIEVAMSALFAGLGVPPSVAIVAVLTYRLISFWTPTIVGIPIAVTLQSRHRK
ncbi:MAG TPA: lysylphosphatidylglycerol synthase transmembrane domain-containing protein [Thermoanaerobaculia bacterium]